MRLTNMDEKLTELNTVQTNRYYYVIRNPYDYYELYFDQNQKKYYVMSDTSFKNVYDAVSILLQNEYSVRNANYSDSVQNALESTESTSKYNDQGE